MMYQQNSNTAKPVYKGHPRDQTKVAVMSRWPFYTGLFTHKTVLWDLEFGNTGSDLYKQEIVVYRWPLYQVLLYPTIPCILQVLPVFNCHVIFLYFFYSR